MNELRWIVPTDTTTEGPVLQFKTEDGWGNLYWQTVPRVVVPPAEFAEAVAETMRKRSRAEVAETPLSR